MVATAQINQYNGAAPGSKTDKASGTVRFKNADNATVDLSNPLVIPTSGREYSYEVALRVAFSGEFTSISNLQAYTDGAPGFQVGSPTEVDVFYATGGSYRQVVVPSESAAVPICASAKPRAPSLGVRARRAAAALPNAIPSRKLANIVAKA